MGSSCFSLFNEELCFLGDSPLQPESAQSSPRPPLPRTAPPLPSSSLYANVTSTSSSLASRARSRDSLSSPHDFEEQRNGRRTSSVSSHGDLRSVNGSRASSVPAERMYLSSAEVMVGKMKHVLGFGMFRKRKYLALFSRHTMVGKQRTLIHSLPFSERRW